MAFNYDPLLNRLRTFRFNHGSDIESMKQARICDVLDIEEFGIYHRTRNFYVTMLFGSIVAAQVVHYYVGRTAAFHGLNPYLRVVLRAGSFFVPYYSMQNLGKREMDKLYDGMLKSKVQDKYINSITLKHPDLSAN